MGERLALAVDHHVLEIYVVGEGFVGVAEYRYFILKFGNIASFLVTEFDTFLELAESVEFLHRAVLQV